MELSGPVEQLVIAAAGVTSVGVLWRKVVVPIVKVSKKIHALDRIAEQFTPNGGDSLVDKVAVIKETQLEILAQRERVAMELVEQTTRVEARLGRIEGTQTEMLDEQRRVATELTGQTRKVEQRLDAHDAEDRAQFSEIRRLIHQPEG